MTRFIVVGLIIIGVTLLVDVGAFSLTPKKSSACATNSFFDSSSSKRRQNGGCRNNPISILPTAPASSTSLNVLLDVPDYFFTFTFPMLGILLSVSKNFARYRLEESAWEQRLEEAREKRLREDPTLTEVELRQKEAALEWSAYGKPRRQEEEAQQRAMREEEFRGSRRVKVMENDYDDDDYEDDFEYRSNRMSDDEINQFEVEYGIEYDPYYDDPYTEDELPGDMGFKIDKKYGDRIYENGEIFYKEKETGLYYRQGAKPRNLSFW